MGMETGAAIMENSIEASKEIETRTTRAGCIVQQ
jgi:hypothetical protein